MKRRARLLSVSLLGLASCDGGTAPIPAPPPDLGKETTFTLFPPANGEKPAAYTKAAPGHVDGQPWSFPSGTEVSVTVDATNVLRPVTPYQLGVNVTLWSGKDWLLDPDRIEKAKQAGIRFWRLPGGSASDTYHWDGNTHGRTVDNEGRDPAVMNQPGFAKTDDFIELCRRTGAEALATINYGCARYDGLELAADMAARWVKYFNVTKQFKVRHWEIGNEPYGAWEDGNTVAGKPAMTGVIYGHDYQVITAAMRAVDPDISIGAPAVRVDGDSYDGYGFWMRDMLPLVESNVDFLFQHYYFGGWPYDSSGAYIPPTFQTFWDDLHQVADVGTATRAMVTRYTSGRSIPIAWTEFNLVESPLQSIELFNALYTAEVLGQQMAEGFSASHVWDWQNGLTDKNGGDHGLLATKDPSVPDGTPRPAYYTYAMFYRAFGDTMIASTSSLAPTVNVLASRFSGGELGLVIVNRGDAPASLSLATTGFTPKGPFNGWVLTGTSLDARQVSWNGEAGPTAGGGPFPLDTIPAYAGRLDRAAPTIAVPPRSLSGIVIY